MPTIGITEDMDSDRIGPPIRNEGAIDDVMDPIESDRSGVARRRFGKVMTEMPGLLPCSS
eukprot:scaffold53430_cov60-Cyclotella_meneghiniana.AAC.2